MPSSGVVPQRADSRPRSITFYLALINCSIFTAQQGKVKHESTKKLVIVLIYIILNVTVIFFFFLHASILVSADIVLLTIIVKDSYCRQMKSQ